MTIPTALDSVLQETGSVGVAVDLLVIDKQSTDDTAGILSNYHDVTVIQQMGHGLANARNEAISHVTAPIVGFCDADDAWVPGSLISRMQVLHSSPQIWGVTGNVLFVDKTESTFGASPRRQAAVEHPGFTPGAMLLRRHAFDVVGYFDESLCVGSDSDWILRASQTLGPLTHVDSVVLKKGLRFGSLSTDTETYRQEMLLIARRFISRVQGSE